MEMQNIFCHKIIKPDIFSLKKCPERLIKQKYF